MANEVKYGVISDVHDDPRIVPLAIDLLIKLGAEKFLVNGDIGNSQKTLKESQGYIALILDSIGKTGLESFVQPGTHEILPAYDPVISYFSEKYPNIIDTIKNPKMEADGHHLVFLPGSDIRCEGDYLFGPEFLTGKSLSINDGDRIPVDSLQEANGYLKMLTKKDRWDLKHYTNVNDFANLVTAPEKTIAICHVPRKFSNIENAVDVAQFGEATCNFTFEGKQIRRGTFMPLSHAEQFIAKGYPVEVQVRTENRGNEALKTLYELLGITKAISGHFHESGHRANDRVGNHVAEGQLVDELFWNSGHLDIGQTGILTVNEGKVGYQNIMLQDYLK